MLHRKSAKKLKNRFFLQKFDMQIVCERARPRRRIAVFRRWRENWPHARAGRGGTRNCGPDLGRAREISSAPRRFFPSRSHMGDPGMRGGSLAGERAPPHHGQACSV